MECKGHGWLTFNHNDRAALIMAPSYELVDQWRGRVHCTACMGSGKVKLSDRKRADLGGFERNAWFRKWRKRYEIVYTSAHSWLSEAHSHLARELKKNSEVA